MKYLLIYSIVAVVFEAIFTLIEWKKAKSYISKNIQVQQFLQAFLSVPTFQNLYQKIWNWYTMIFIGGPLFIIVSQFLFPYSLFLKTRRLLFGKTKLEKESDKHKKAMERTDEWMKNEGEEETTTFNFRNNDFIKKRVDQKDEPKNQ